MAVEYGLARTTGAVYRALERTTSAETKRAQKV